ncbi:hypothetical protein DBV15_06756, partial [Temnothorax longispinosus]
ELKKINHSDTVPLLGVPLINFLPETSSAFFLEEKRLTQTGKSSASTEADRKSPISAHTGRGRRSGEMDYIESAADFIIRSTEYPFVVGPSLQPPGFPSPRGYARPHYFYSDVIDKR